MREALIQIRADSEAALNEVFERATNAMRSGKSLRARGSLHLCVARTAFFCHHPQKVGID
ncbi:hypothetical protein FHR76_002811 [Rhizobium sp. RAS22]|nr:hypothetical protein [Rhizobium sp. RAS22]